MRHRWQNNVCVNCGLKRKRKGWKLRMAITDFPPYDHYLRGTDWVYYGDGTPTFKRPDCQKVSLTEDKK